MIYRHLNYQQAKIANTLLASFLALAWLSHIIKNASSIAFTIFIEKMDEGIKNIDVSVYSRQMGYILEKRSKKNKKINRFSRQGYKQKPTLL